MNALDYTMLAVIGISALLGLLRGFVREVVSLLVWIAAIWLAMTYSSGMAERLGGFIHNPSARLAGAFIALFLSVLIVGVIINYLLASLLKKAGVRTSDRILGVMFGMARGVLIVILAVVLVELTPLVDSSSWRDSLLVEHAHPLLAYFQKLLPAGMRVGMNHGWGGVGR